MVDLLAADELRETWQVRVLIATRDKPLGMVVLSMIDHSFDEVTCATTEILLRVAFPGFVSITKPFFKTCGKINKTGCIVADVEMKNGSLWKDALIFRDTQDMRWQFRKLADKLKLNDTDRLEMFKTAQAWVLADRRRNPRMDPRDPDSITHAIH